MTWPDEWHGAPEHGLNKESTGLPSNRVQVGRRRWQAKLTLLNPLYRERKVAYQLDDAETVVVVAARFATPTVATVHCDIFTVYMPDLIDDILDSPATAELEAVLLEHLAVLDACVNPKPVPDASDGEIPKAFVVCKADEQVTADEIIAFVAERLAPYKTVRELAFVDSIPKTASGRLLRFVLIEQERSGVAGG